MIFRIRFSLNRRGRLVSGLLGFAGLALSAGAQTTTAERALLNRIDTPLVRRETPTIRPIDGARALLNRAGASEAQGLQASAGNPSSPAGAHRIDGPRALLGTFEVSAIHASAAPRK